MYLYNESDRTLLRERVHQFRGQVDRFLTGDLPEEEFKQLRLRNGLYMQLHAPMLRVAIPYGLLSSDQVRMLAHVARTYDRGYGHMTTRQNIQYNWLKLEQVPDLLADLARVDMHAIQTSGNVVRNISTDHLAGVAEDEIEDPRLWCELLRQWSTLHPEFYWLPRKFKIAVTGARKDRAAIRFHDIGLRIIERTDTETIFEVWVGGGLGRSPFKGQVIRERLPGKHLLSYVEAILRVYNLLGRRDNKHKARIKILVNALGIEEFRHRVEDEWQVLIDQVPLAAQDISKMRTHFTQPEYDTTAFGLADRVTFDLERDSEFAAWYERNTRAHRQPGYRVVYVSLKAPGEAPGDISAAQLDQVASFADRYSFGEVRTTHGQNLVLADVPMMDLYYLWQGLRAHGLATPNIGTLADIICCPGGDYCSLANAGSVNVTRDLNRRFDSLDYLYDLGEIEIKISGCMNGCGHHHIGHIGVLGVEKHGQDWYQLTLGGAAGEDGALGERLGKAVPASKIADVFEALLTTYLNERDPGERFIDTWRRVGTQPFQRNVYGDPKKTAERSLAA